MTTTDYKLIAKAIIDSIKHYQECGRSPEFTIDSIADYIGKVTDINATGIAEIVLEAENRVANAIKDDMEIGHMQNSIINRIKTGTYVGSDLLTYKSFKKKYGVPVKLTDAQISDVIEWMNQWEQLKDTAIPIRFKEEYKERNE